MIINNLIIKGAYSRMLEQELGDLRSSYIAIEQIAIRDKQWEQFIQVNNLNTAKNDHLDGFR